MAVGAVLLHIHCCLLLQLHVPLPGLSLAKRQASITDGPKRIRANGFTFLVCVCVGGGVRLGSEPWNKATQPVTRHTYLYGVIFSD